MNNRVGMIVAAVVAAAAIIFAIVQSGNLSQSETRLSALRSTSTAQQSAFANQGTAVVATLSAANTLSAEAANAAATAQAQALTDAENAAATAQAQALTDAENAAATAQAEALADAANAASTLQAQALAAAAQAAATAEANAVESAENTAATAQANALATAQAQATGTLAAVMDAAEEAQSAAVADAQDVAATAQHNALATAQAQATATLGAVVAQAATSEQAYSATQDAMATQLAEANSAVQTAQANTTNIGKPTAVPTNEAAGIPDNWRRYVGNGIAIQLPEGYIGSELGSDPELLGEMLRSLGPDFESAADLFEQNPDLLAFIAVHPGGRGMPPSNVIVVTIDLPFSVPVSMLLDATASQLPGASSVVEQDVVDIGDYEAGRMIVETNVGFVTTLQLQYYIVDGTTVYLVGFTASPDDFESLLDTFDQSMETFEILSNSDM
ncbi:MAG: hypothetical protein LCI00_09360 [Chloroflexi bacterium]|nr:hypothetical protein [Chloroflexota bacterium]MCC6893067.1 hypothetical protein [Anaerolineae bacterium]